MFFDVDEEYSLILFSLMMRISLEVYEFNYELFDYEVTVTKTIYGYKLEIIVKVFRHLL